MDDPNDVNDDLQVNLSSGNIITQLLSKHTNASQPESQQVVAVLRALQEVLESQGMNPSPTAVFAAIMTPLSQPEIHKRSSVEEIGAMATILSSVLPHTPAPALLPQYETVIQVMKALLVALAASTSPLRAALKCSGCVLRVVTADQWDKTEVFFCEVLKMCSDHRPKVRKQASAAIDVALRAVEGTTVADKAGQQVAAHGVQVLAATGVAAQARRGKKGAELKAAEELVEKAVKEALHLLTTYKHLLPLIGPKAGAMMCDPLVQLHAQGQPVLSQHAVDTLTELGTHLDATLEAAPLAKMLKNVIKVNYDKKDLPLVLAVQRLLSQGFVRLHSMDPDASGKQLAQAVHHLVPHLALQEGIVYGATECLKTLIRTCVDAKMVQQTVQHMALAQQDDETAPGKMAPLQSVVVAVEAALGYRYRAAWPSVLPVASTLVERLGALSGMLLGGVLTALGELASAREPASWPAVQTTFGTILRVMGPEHVLAALPLNLEQAVSMEGAEDEGDGWFDVAGCNVWLLPLLKQHLLGARLAYFASDILPLAKRMAENSKKAAASRKPLQAQRAITAEYQLWSTLPAFVTWCQDTPQAFPTIARDLGAYLQHREDLRTVVCSALQRIVSQNKQMVEGGSTEAPVGYTTELAAASIASVANFAKNFMPILFNLFVTVPLEHRGVIHNTIAAFASIADPATLGGFFRTIIKKLIKVQTDPEGAPGALLEGGDSIAARRCTFMELALALEPGLDDASVEMMFKLARTNITDADSTIQKKAYKLLATLFESRAEHARSELSDLHDALAAALSVCAPSAKRNRLKCLRSMILMLNAAKEAVPAATQSIPAFVGEVVLGCKEINTKTRGVAYDLLINIARGMEQQDEDGMGDEGEDSLQECFAMVLAGLASENSSMISATVLALSRLLFEFSAALIQHVPELLPSVTQLIRLNNREITKSVLGFCKVAAMRLPLEQLQEQLPVLLEGLLHGDEKRNRFRLKVKTVLERLVRRCGHDAVAERMPEAHVALLQHMRKMKERGERKKRAASEAGSVAGKSKAGSRAASSSATARRSEWQHSMVFGGDDDDEDDDMESGGMGGARSQKGGKSSLGTRKTDGGRDKGKNRGIILHDEGLDLLDETAMRRSLKSTGPSGSARRTEEDFHMDHEGKMVISETWQDKKGGRKRLAGERDDLGSDDDDDKASVKTRTTQGGKSQGGKSMRSEGRKSQGGRSAATSAGGRSTKRQKYDMNSGGLYKAKKGTGGDRMVGKMDPYAYWQFDPKMLNRRAVKKKAAEKGLSKVIARKSAGSRDSGSRAHRAAVKRRATTS